MKLFLKTIFVLLAICTISSCKEDDYEYPPVKLEFLTVNINTEGIVKNAITDGGELLTITQDKTNTKFEPNSVQRIIANIEQYDDNTAIIYSLASPISVAPLSIDSPEFEEGIKLHPVDVLSMWQGSTYLNMILLIKTHESKHIFHFVEQSCELNDAGVKTVRVLLYHDSGSDVPKYNTKRAYASVPINQYLDELTQSVSLYFDYANEDGKIKECGPYHFKKDI